MPHSSLSRWLVVGLIAWPALALAPVPQGAALWSAVFHEREEDRVHDAVVLRAPRQVVDWILLTRDNGGPPFLVVDKPAAQLHVFDAAGALVGTTPILLGAARGDESVPGIGERPLASILPEEKTTPAGRFVAERGRNLAGEDVMWIDYDAAVSMHRVRATDPRERRLQRLASPTSLDNRISFGCINVPAHFYEDVVRRAFAGGRAIVYVLPETRPALSLFGWSQMHLYKKTGPAGPA